MDGLGRFVEGGNNVLSPLRRQWAYVKLNDRVEQGRMPGVF